MVPESKQFINVNHSNQDLLLFKTLLSNVLWAYRLQCAFEVTCQIVFDDIQEISKEIDLKDLDIVYTKTMDEVLVASFDKFPLKSEKAKSKKKTSKK